MGEANSKQHGESARKERVWVGNALGLNGGANPEEEGEQGERAKLDELGQYEGLLACDVAEQGRTEAAENVHQKHAEQSDAAKKVDVRVSFP